MSKNENALIAVIEAQRLVGVMFASRDLTSGEIHELIITEFPVQCSGRRTEARFGARVHRAHSPVIDPPIFWVPAEDLMWRLSTDAPWQLCADLPECKANDSNKLPIIEELEQADTFSKMAEWLCACPLAIFASHGDQIEGLVAQRGFAEASTYVQKFMSAVHMTRKGGFHPYDTGDNWSDNPFSRVDMSSQAKRMDQAVDLIIGIDLDWHRASKVTANAG